MAIEYRKFLTGAGAKEIVRRLEIVRRAVRVLDLELLCRLWKLEKHVDDIEEAGLGGHLDDYETKAEAEASHVELQAAMEGKQDALKAYAETEASADAYNGVTAKLGGTEISFVNLLGTAGNLEIEKAAYLNGVAQIGTLGTEEELLHHRHQTQDVGEEGNVDIVTRMLDAAFEECVQFLYPLARIDIEDGEEMDDKLVVREEYNISLSVSEKFSRTTLGLLSKKIHNYMVYSVLARWLSVTSPKVSEKYGVMAETEAEAIKEVRFQGSGVVRRQLYPF